MGESLVFFFVCGDDLLILLTLNALSLSSNFLSLSPSNNNYIEPKLFFSTFSHNQSQFSLLPPSSSSRSTFVAVCQKKAMQPLKCSKQVENQPHLAELVHAASFGGDLI